MHIVEVDASEDQFAASPTTHRKKEERCGRDNPQRKRRKVEGREKEDTYIDRDRTR